MKSKFAKTLVAGASIAALAVSGMFLTACGGDTQPSSTVSSKSTQSATASKSDSAKASYKKHSEASGEYAAGKHTAVVTVEGYEPFTIELDADSAPLSVQNFCELANDGYYDGLAFYRMQDGFCLQGGTKGNSASGQDKTLTPIQGEFSTNKIENPLADDFKKGVVAMARTNDKNSAGSTFFVTLGSDPQSMAALNGQYAAFGTIDDAGMKIVDKICDSMKDAADSNMGMISDESKMPIITSIVID